jgi:hypothetical protein
MRKLYLVLFVLTNYFGFSQNTNEALVAFHKNTRNTLLIAKRIQFQKGKNNFHLLHNYLKRTVKQSIKNEKSSCFFNRDNYSFYGNNKRTINLSFI